jgi:hypothetical protein
MRFLKMKMNKKTLVKLSLASMAATVGTSVNAAALTATDFGTLESDISGTIAVAAGIGVALMVVGLGWDVGISLVKKFVKRGAK